MHLIVAGYTAAPRSRADRLAYYQKLVSVPAAEGLEFGWLGPESVEDLDDVLSVLPDDWSVTLNDITGTFRSSVTHPTAGLASPDADGRAAAVALARRLAESVRAMNDQAGRRAVLAVEVHSAPGFANRVVEPDAGAFTRSLNELADCEWDGAEVLVEHCDALVDGQTPAKGFLRIEDEIAALAEVDGSGFGLSVNWGRSLIELRDPVRVVEHIDIALESRLLRAITFSGTAGVDSSYGVSWADSHLPFADPTDGDYAEPASLMTQRRVRTAIEHLGDWDGCFVAAKTQWRSDRIDPADRAMSVEANFATLTDLLRAAR
jgi:Domain of unknown function (DUF4862)